ncbi:MAG: SMP-30/gluconolactonase/LRE family protein [Frankia sp.]|nr:SMP-30/gluconolactonase/LRE family protein [Frankia sp.]
MEVLARGLQFPEGPVALDDGSVLVVEIEGGALARVSPDGAPSRLPCGPGPNGAAPGPDGAVYLCDNGGLAFTTEDGIRFPNALAPGNDGGSVRRADLATGTVEVVFTHVGDRRIGSLNDIVFDRHGGCYIVDTTHGAVYHADPAAGSIRTAVDGLAFPNGMGLSPDGTRLYVSETYSGRLLAFDVTRPGELAGMTELYSSGGAHGFDGLAVDGVGNVCVANLARSGISVISPDGRLLREVTTPEYDPYVTNICFGGPTGDTAFICSSGRGILYATPWPWPGLRLHFAR